MLVFGLETTFRSLRRVRFPTRNRWHIPTAIMLVAAMIFFAWAATNVFPTRGKCLTGLVWWTARYAKLAVVLSSGLLTLYPASAVIITLQLVKTVKVEKAERIAATRVVYYLVVNIWLIVWFQNWWYRTSELIIDRHSSFPIISRFSMAHLRFGQP